MSTDLNEQPFDPNQRRLCPDGSCVGVIGDDGKCKLCGAVDPDGPPVARQEEAPPPAQDLDPKPEASAAPVDSDGFDPGRRLCADDSCIGVLDESGRCKVCGRVG